MFVFGLLAYPVIDETYTRLENSQELQMHLDKVMDELNDNNREGAKVYLQSIQEMISTREVENKTALGDRTVS